MGDFKGKICVVTGGTQGVGAAVAKYFAQEEAAAVIICGRNEIRGAEVARTLQKLGTHPLFVPARLQSESDCVHVIQSSLEAFGQIDTLVNAGGTTERNSITDFSAANVGEMFAINVTAPMILMRECIKSMRCNGNEGTIVNVSSVVASGGPDFLCAYSASKAALETVTKNAAYAVMRSLIRVNAIAPGWIDTPGENTTQMTFHHQDSDWLTRAEKEQPFGRLIKVDELARAIGFLSGPRSGLMTGAIVHFDQSVPGAGGQPIPPSTLS